MIPKIDRLSTKLLDDWVSVGEGADITFEKSSKDNSDCQSISSIVAVIFVTSLQKNVRITDQSPEHLAKALNSNDKQTFILSAKSLYLALETHDIKNEVLIELREHVDDRIPDVSVYSTVVYAQSLRKLSAKAPIMASHIGFLPTIYVYDDLRLDEESFSDVVNKNILFVLNNKSETKQFEDDVFRILDHILLFGNRNQVEAIKILRQYSTTKYPIPENTLFALENVVGIPEFLQVFENIIKNRQIVSENILHIIADKLYLSDDNRLRDESFQLLDIANDNQDISDEIFDILELERASLAISSFLSDSDDTISYLYAKTKEGQKLTINGFRGLSKAIDNHSVFKEEILRILLNVSNNGQIISNELIDILVIIFDPKQVQHHLIEIFENLVKNNQNISTELSLKLEKALKNRLICDQVLFIFILQGQKGEKLPEKIISKMLDKFSSIENPLTIQQYLSVICSIIQKKDCFEYDSKSSFYEKLSQVFGYSLITRVQSALIHALKTSNQDVVRKSLGGLKTLVSLHKVKLKKDSIEALLSLATKAICDENIKQEITMILDISKLEESQKCMLKLCNLKYASSDQLLDILTKFGELKLLEQNFDRINSIIDDCPELNSKALEILLKCSNKKNIPYKLLDSIAVLLASTTSETIKSFCYRLIAETAVAGRAVKLSLYSITKKVLEFQNFRISEFQTHPYTVRDSHSYRKC
ncbi:unnamed protein product [Didymodactylos carnosus]|uniref:Uncharacterized protein n=1 Tax=Didymodactylos carnosus TaxID=1234261 RepID=A0A814LRA5_9BILA|nr:unnamed protein product [Didymodactylos carnosus]CAF3835104.1 unnamed protein product [Didymodactylos carnosus]